MGNLLFHGVGLDLRRRLDAGFSPTYKIFRDMALAMEWLADKPD